MSNNKPIYNAGNAVPQTVEAFRNKACALPFAHSDYSPPKAVEVKALIAIAGWSQSDVAKITGVNFREKKGSSTVRRWQVNEDDPNFRQIPYAAFRLLLIHAGVVTVEEETAPAVKRGLD